MNTLKHILAIVVVAMLLSGCASAKKVGPALTAFGMMLEFGTPYKEAKRAVDTHIAIHGIGDYRDNTTTRSYIVRDNCRTESRGNTTTTTCSITVTGP